MKRRERAWEFATREEWSSYATRKPGARYPSFPVIDEPIVLVSCAAKKLESPAPAKDLYVSNLFRLARRYAEALGYPWGILSAKHGVVMPDQVIEPYDVSLNKLDPDYLYAWRNQVDTKLRRYFPGQKNAIVLAGGRYVKWLPSWLNVQDPMKGLGVGQRMAWLKREAIKLETRRQNAGELWAPARGGKLLHLWVPGQGQVMGEPGYGAFLWTVCGTVKSFHSRKKPPRAAKQGKKCPACLVAIGRQAELDELKEKAKRKGIGGQQARLRLRYMEENPSRDERMRRLERAGDKESRVRLARERIRCGSPTGEDVWVGFLHDLEQIVSKHGWVLGDPYLGQRGPWGFVRIYSKPPSQSEAPGMEDVGIARLVVGLRTWGRPYAHEAEMAPERLWPSADLEFTAHARQVMLPYMEGVLL